MKTSRTFLIPLTAALMTTSHLTAHAFTLVEDGKPRAAIVVSSSALNPAKDDAVAQKISSAARDLQEYIKKMSSAVLPLVSEDAKPSGPLILVGPSHLTDEMKLSIPSGLTSERREEGYLIQSTADRLVLAGNDAGPYHGTEYAAYELLNRLGVRWFMPGEFGEVVPRSRTIAVGDIKVQEKPDFIQRNWWNRTSDKMAVLERQWKIRNKMNPDNMFDLPTDGSVVDFMAPPEQAKEHPELFAKNYDGSVNTSLPNLSNPETVKIAAEKAEAYFRAHPEANSVGMSPTDGLPRDFTSETVKRNQGFAQLGGRDGVPMEMSGSEEWFEWVNAVTREVNRVFPDRIITTNGYANRTDVPLGVKIDPHLSIMFASIWSDTLHALDNPKSWQTIRQGQLLHEWTRVNSNVWVYGYDYIMLVSALTPVPGVHKLEHDFPLMKKWGVVGFLNETRNVWMERGIATHYLEARSMWNANTNVKALLADFYTQWYGASAKPAAAFWEALEDTMENTPLLGHEDRILPWVYTPQLLAQLQKDIISAEALAVTPAEKLHVKADRLIFEHLQAYMAMSRADLNGDYAEAARQGERMMAARAELSPISPFFVSSGETDSKGNLDLYTGVYYWGITDRIKYYQALADQMTGKSGSLLAFLPQRAAFTLDPQDEGRSAGWWRSDCDTKEWNSVTTAEPFFMQGPKDHPYMDQHGYPYVGAMWYQFKVVVPAVKNGESVKLYVPTVETQAWLWINGQYIGSRPYAEAYVRPNDMDVDVTSALHPGTNIVTFRVATSLNNVACASGLLSRLFLYSPKATITEPTATPTNDLQVPLNAAKADHP